MSYFKKSLLLLLVLSLSLSAFVPGKVLAAPTDIRSVTEIGFVRNPLRPQFVRDGGDSAILGGKVFWTFGDTLFSPQSVDGESLRSNTAGYAELNDPFNVVEPLDANGAPYQFIPLSAEDQDYNDNEGAPNDRYAIWVNSVIPRPEQNDALVYFVRLKINPTGNLYQLLNTGIAVVNAGETTAEVVVPELFMPPDPQFFGAKYYHEGYIYIHNCTNGFANQCSIGRVEVENALDRNSYRFWDGDEWSPDVDFRKEDYPGRSTGWSPTLQKFTMFDNPAFSGEMYLRTADNPEGPWSDAQLFYTAPANTYALKYQSHLEKPEEGKMYVTYYQNNQAGTVGIHVLEIVVPPRITTASPSDESDNENSAGTPKTGLIGGVILTTTAAITGGLVLYGWSKKKKGVANDK